jgi:uncharacterized protein (TIGR02001 family)
MIRLKIVRYLVFSIFLLMFTNVSSNESNHEFGGTLWLTSNYMYRGISNTDNNPAIQLELDYSYTPIGFYAYVWGSNIDFNDGESDYEIDYGIGFAGAFNNDVGWDVGIVYYSYPDSSIKPEYDYFDAYAGISYTYESILLKPTIGTTFWYSPEYFGEDDAATYIEANLNLTLPHDVSLSLHAGYQDVSGNKTSGPAGYDFADYSIGLAKNIIGIDMDLTYSNTIDQTDACGNTDICDGTITFTASRSF